MEFPLDSSDYICTGISQSLELWTCVHKQVHSYKVINQNSQIWLELCWNPQLELYVYYLKNIDKLPKIPSFGWDVHQLHSRVADGAGPSPAVGRAHGASRLGEMDDLVWNEDFFT